jgi:hypothetical protein
MNCRNYKGFDVFTAVVMKSPIFWGITLALFSDPEDGGDIYLQNFGSLSTDFTALYPRR